MVLCLAWVPLTSSAGQTYKITITVWLEPKPHSPAAFDENRLPANLDTSDRVQTSPVCEMGASHLEMSRQANNLLVTVVPE